MDLILLDIASNSLFDNMDSLFPLYFPGAALFFPMALFVSHYAMTALLQQLFYRLL